ncbi:rod shape determining protein RodA [Pustulibacterium marinum]|uniref:Rod shape determining protein RodA n=1 Tax=Pustulibacterium marinum TaxID=1224947 RepID=A0A1I7EV62_9FLAO|nr:rod shape-determining protein RodA [Pustulibacterium marinum]SFU27811.1 rod shape determining protein RodA [Pustulibacterium marinum]
MAKNTVVKKIDWLSIVFYMLLVGIGWLNIYSASVPVEEIGAFNINNLYGKQLIFIGLSVVLILFILAIEAKFYERFASIIYIVAMLSLIGLFIFGKNVNGARAWYGIGSFTLQPSEFAKTATALAFAKYISDIQTHIKNFQDQLKAILIIAIPSILILLQPDPGSTLVYSAFLFVLYREGLPGLYIFFLISLAFVFIATLKFGIPITLAVIGTGIVIYYLIKRTRNQKKAHKKKIKILPMILYFVTCIAVSGATSYIYDNVFKQHHRDRFVLWLRLENDPVKMQELKRDIGYNINQSETAIGSGGLMGKGFLQGTRTRGNYVPEQHTDYIFTTVGEEWGFAGTLFVVLLFTALLLRLLFLAERQRSQFSRVYGYSVAGIFFIHFMVNIGMVIGLLPTIGIPLPFFSYGGSGLWGFTILLFIFLKLDANRGNDWMEA